MTEDTRDEIEGLEPEKLMRAALGPSDEDPEAAERAANEEAEVRASIGKHLPDLELIELLGRGGMGYVYRARQIKLDREVALKVVAPDVEGREDFGQRFEREAKALARLSHPNIVSVYDYGRDGDFAWLLMEYIDGSNLAEVIRDGKLDPGEALTLVPKICDALQFAHDLGVVHRDVKPENILLDAEGNVKIADFGLAKLVGAPAAVVSLTGTQQVLGTFRYMAPEQLERPLEVDHRADIYSLGVVFYEMLTGEIPMGRFDPPSLRSTASTHVDDVVLRALEKEPDRRYQRAAEVKSDVESVARGGTSSGTLDKGTQVSFSALAGLLFFLFGAPAYIVLGCRLLASTARSDGGSSTLSIADVVVGSGGFVGFLLLVVASVHGFRAMTQIRSDWPHRTGAIPAVIAAWGGPLLFLSTALVPLFGLVWGPPAGPLDVVLQIVPWLVLSTATLILLGRRFFEQCRAD